MGQPMPKPAGGNACIRMERLKERITLLVKKPKTAVYTAALVLLIAGISVACTFTGGKDDVELTDPFGREYETAEIVGCSPYYTDFTDMQMGVLALAKINAEGTRTVTLSNDDIRCEYETVTEVTLTREDFDARFKSKTDGPTEWLDKNLSVDKLRRNNAKAWLCTSTAADESGWANRVYLLQQKDGTLYLVMAEEQEPSESYPDGRNYVCFVHRLNEKPMPVYDSMEDYALAQIKAIRENGISYYVRDKDGFSEEFFDTVEDVRVKNLSCLGELSDFAPDGTLELWCFIPETKPSNQAGNEIMLVGGQNLSDDGYYSDGYHTYLVMLRKDDGYHTLRSFHSNDGYEVGRYPTVEAYLHDAYCEIMGFPGPYSLIERLFRYTDGYGNEVSDNGILTRGDGWYFYLPSGEAWVRGGIHNLWYSAYSTESTITVNAFDATVEETAASLIGDGWTKETSGALTVYRRCRPPLPQSLIPSFDAYGSIYLYERPEGGHYEVLTVWYDRADEVNEWGWSPKAQVAAERTQLETMVQSFTVVPADESPEVPDFTQWCSRFRDENITNLSISVDSAAALGYTGETLKSMASELEQRLRALTGGHRVQLPDADAFDDAICLVIGDNKDEYMINLSADGNYANTLHVLGALRADEEGKYFRPEAYYDAPWIASWIRAKAIPLLEGDLPEAVLPIEEETHEEDGVSQTVMSIQGEFPGGTRLTVGTFELPKGAVTFSGAWSPSYASVCAIVKPSKGDGTVVYFKPGESVSVDFGRSGSCDIVLLAPKEGIDGTVSVDMHQR